MEIVCRGRGVSRDWVRAREAVGEQECKRFARYTLRGECIWNVCVCVSPREESQRDETVSGGTRDILSGD